MKILFSILILLCAVYDATPQSGEFYEISRLPFTSSKFDEFAPAFYNQGIVFTSNRRIGFIITRITDDDENLLNIYYAGKGESGRWNSPGLLDKSLKSNYHDGPVSFAADGSRIFFTRNVPGRGNEPSKLGIFMADYSDGEWVNITPFPFNSNNYNVTHPSISTDGRILYFASDMPGGFGRMDIYRSELQGQSWTAPVNLGETVNSAGNDVFPGIHRGGRLYFSSDRDTGSNLDLYYSFTRNNNWQHPVRMGEPFNSDADDFGFIADPDIVSGYFTSSREGTDNIYSFISTFPVFQQCDSLVIDGLCFEFYEQRAQNIDTTTFYLEWDMGDGTRVRGMVADHCFDDYGTYQVTLDRIDLVTGEVASNVASYRFTTPRTEQPFITSPDTAYIDTPVTLDASETYLRNAQPDEFYWDMGDGTKATGEVVSHTYTMPGVYEVRLGVLTDPESMFGQQRFCSYKYIVVLDPGSANTKTGNFPEGSAATGQK